MDDFEAAITHDFENCQITRSIPNLVFKIQKRLRAINLRYWVGPTRIYAGNESTLSEEHHALMQGIAGFQYYQTPSLQYSCDRCNTIQLAVGTPRTGRFNRNTDLADCVLIEEMFGRALLRTLPKTVIMITTDSDFNIAMDYLKGGEYRLFCARNIIDGENEVREPRWAYKTVSWEELERTPPV